MKNVLLRERQDDLHFGPAGLFQHNRPIAEICQVLVSEPCLRYWWTMRFERPAALASALLLVSLTSATAEQPEHTDRLGCWETEARKIERQGMFHAAFCFLKGGRLYGQNMHGTSGNDFEFKWRRVDRAHIEIDGQKCAVERSRDGATLRITDCPNFARDWKKADAQHVLPTSR